MAKLERGVNDLATVCPDIAAEWHPTKNGDLTPADVTCGSGEKVYWRCRYGHEWRASVSNRVNGSGCPVCANRVVLSGFNDLQTKFPDIASEWHSIKNGDLKPTDVVPGSGKRVFWRCKHGHEWESAVNNRVRGSGCPVCASHVVLQGVNDLQTKFPDIALEWHPVKNGNLKPADVMPGSMKRIYWRCEHGHEWQAPVYSRTAGRGCPVCAGQVLLRGVNDLQTLYPELAAEWHPTKNGDLKPTDVMSGSDRKVYWRCKYGHEWKAAVKDRKKGQGCPVCSGNVVLSGFNDLQTKFPSIAAEWHPTKNGDLTPADVTRGSDKRVYWRCKHGHEWMAAIKDRTGGTGCPVCNGEHSTSFPEYAILFYVKSVYADAVTRNKDYGIELDVFIPSVRVAIEYDGVFYHRSDKATQKEKKKNKICVDNDIVLVRIREKGLCSYDDCLCYFRENNNSNRALSEVIATVLKDVLGHDVDVDVDRDSALILSEYYALKKENSLEQLYPEIASEWHPTKNGNLTPVDVTPRSNKRVYWRCKNGHEWQATVGDRTYGHGCPYCAGKAVLQGVNDLQTKFPEIASEWHPTKNGNLKPTDVMSRSSKKAYWLCKYGHEWKVAIRTRASGNGCPICAGKAVLQGFNDLQTKRPEIAAEWHPTKNGDLKPTDVTCGSHKRIYWRCVHGHEWRASVEDRTGGHGCPVCAGKAVWSGYNDLLTKFPEIAAEWHPAKNGDLTPTDVKPGSDKRVWWRCQCGHEWVAAVKDRAHGHGCPVCARTKRSNMSRLAHFKRVSCVETGTVYDGISVAAATLHVSRCGIDACLHGRQKTAGGYHWKYVDDA